MSVVHVAVGVVFNSSGEICIAKRPQGKHLSGYWEFPGGKIESGESVFTALKRELEEEISISILHSQALTKIEFDYPDKQVLLDVHLVREFDGAATGREQQEVKWVSKKNLHEHRFPDANKPIIDAILALE